VGVARLGQPVRRPQPPKLIAEALEGSPSIAQAHARLAKASPYIDGSRSALYPKVNGSYSWTRELFSANRSSYRH
jgi:outer membrane protein TolC